MTKSMTAAGQDRLVPVFRECITREFAFLKNTTRLDDLYAKGFPVEDGAGFLVPLAELHAEDPVLIEQLGRWREQAAYAYPTRFPVTAEGTKRWIRAGVLDNPGRILFLVADPAGNFVGHLGFANCLNDDRRMEIDNVLRGVKGAHPGIMARAMRTVMTWAREMFLPELFDLHVLADNPRAIAFYEALGFVESRRIPLRRHEEGERMDLKPVEPGDEAPADSHYVEMRQVPEGEVVPGKTILTAGPSVGSRECSYVLDACRHGWNSNWSGYLKKFEQAFCDYLDMPYAMATSSCTGALHIALMALGVGPGDEVIVPDMTWVATAQAVNYVGAIPVFADIEPDSWCMDPASFESKITDKTKAVMPVHLYGHPARMDRIMEIARRHGLYVVEDAAPAIGAEFQGQRVGTFGDFATFSFQGAKLLVTGEGGMLVARDKELYEKAYKFWDQGRKPGTFWIEEVGVKYKMSNMQAAFGLGQLERAAEQIEAKRRIFGWYAEFLEGLEGITLNHECSWGRSICWMTSLLLDPALPIGRDEFIAALKARSVDSRPTFPAISQYPIWPRPQKPQPVAFSIGERGVNLPSGVRLTRAEIRYVCQAIRDVVGAAAK